MQATYEKSILMDYRKIIALGAAVVIAACAPADPIGHQAGAQDSVPPTQNVPHAPAGGYHVVALPIIGKVTGSVVFQGATPADSIIHPTVDADVCGSTLVDPTVLHRGPNLAGAVVWLSGVTAGKHLPYTRRFDIVTQGCKFVPRVQAAIVGGTLDVRSTDATTHRTTFARDGKTIAVIGETEEGQVVPNATVLGEAGLVQVGCTPHPWSKGWIAVFDQPYYTTSDADGKFAIDSVPPGRYEVTAWHERFGVVRDSVTVGASTSAAVTLTFRGPAPRS
jgi:hypothetical protein